jgi:hypothetical protein
MIEYLLILALYSLGAWFSALQKVMGIRARNQLATIKEVWKTYRQEEWNTVFSVVGCLALVEIAWYVIHLNNVKVPVWFHQWGVHASALLAGWCLHRLIFKLLGTTERAVEKKIEDKINGI